jgi:beta-lactamase regulating signal transducer with metallopeptidase domain
MSLAGAILIVAIIFIRVAGRHSLPKRTLPVLWGVALLRLVVPVAINSPVSVFNLTRLFESPAIPESTAVFMPDIPAGMPAIGDFQAVEIMQNAPSPQVYSTFSPLLAVYLVGAAALAAFFAVLYVKNRREFSTSLPLPAELTAGWLGSFKMWRKVSFRVSDKISAPLTYGVIRPVVLLPKNTDLSDERGLQFIIAHELTHIKRLDALTKLFMIAVLCLHWFNPAVWVMFILFNRDMEISCDEAVINTFGDTAKQDYSLTLINMVAAESRIPLYNNFSKYAIEERITAIAKLKNRTLSATIAAFAVVIATTAVFATVATDNLPYIPAMAEYYEAPPVTLEPTTPDTPVTDTVTTGLSGEEAELIGLAALQDRYGIDTTGIVVDIHFLEQGATALDEYGELINIFPESWWGTVFSGPLNSAYTEMLYIFAVDYATGEVLETTRIADAEFWTGDTAVEQVIPEIIELTPQQFYHYAQLAMDYVEAMNLLSGTIERARVTATASVFPDEDSLSLLAEVICTNDGQILFMFDAGTSPLDVPPIHFGQFYLLDGYIQRQNWEANPHAIHWAMR